MGFYELKELGIPTVKWQEFLPDAAKISDDKLWTVRTAIMEGNDLNLPRAVGVDALEAKNFANQVYNKYNGSAMVIYYPYFIAIKSGTLEIKKDGFVIESTLDDLWNLVTYGRCDQTIIANGDIVEVHGKSNFLSNIELDQLKKNIPLIRRSFSSLIREGQSILLEWSFAVETNLKKEKMGEPYLVFYECRAL